MKIQINTGKNIQGDEALSRHAETVIEATLGHHAEHLTRVEAHLSDENSIKGGDTDKRCVLEARIEGRPPIAVTHDAANLRQAISGAADKLKASLDNTLGKRNRR